MKNMFTPLKIRNISLENRICVPPMVCFHFAESDGRATDKNVEHYRQIAKGGFGLIIQEATCVSEEGRLTATQLGAWEDGQVEGLERIAQAVHEEGGKLFVQLHHAGIMGITEPLDCPSGFTMERKDGKQVTGVEMTGEKIQEIKKQFADAAKRVQAAGYDGIELHGCHSYLISQFLNNRVNTRTDAYGENPSLFALEVLAEVRKAVGDSMVVGIRLGGFEPTLEDGVAHARTLEKAGIDFLNISYGFASESSPYCPEGYPFTDIIYAAQEIKKSVGVPVFAVGGIRSAQQAENILDKTGVDMMNIGRGTLVNYNWANDAKHGRDTGTCLGCNACMWRIDAAKCPGKIRFSQGSL